MRHIFLAALLWGIAGGPAAAQDPHAGHVVPPPPPTPTTPADAEHAEHAEHTTHSEHATAEKGTGASLAVSSDPPPATILDSAADKVYGADAMDRARMILADEHGGMPISKVMANILEYATIDDDSGYRWDLEAWYGGDIHRFVFKTEGEGVGGDGPQLAEAQALYSRAIGPYTDLQAGVRYDFEPDGRAYATVSVESLLPYWVEVEAAAFMSDRGDAFGRLEASHDLRLTQRLILQPRVEMELAAQDVPESGVGSGFSSAELGLRLRYDVRREFAPYIGVNFEWLYGQTADFARAAGEDEEETSFVIGVRAWF